MAAFTDHFGILYLLPLPFQHFCFFTERVPRRQLSSPLFSELEGASGTFL